jgi:hypothetical protein
MDRDVLNFQMKVPGLAKLTFSKSVLEKNMKACFDWYAI